MKVTNGGSELGMSSEVRGCIINARQYFYEPVFVHARGDGAQLYNKYNKKQSESGLVHTKLVLV